MSKTKKKKSPYNQNSAIRGALRRAFARSPIVQEIMAESRREVPRYKKNGSLAKKPHVQRQCQVCDQWVGSSKISVDHIEPVVSVDEGFIDWNAFVARLWCSKENLQRICDTCHDAKTYKEKIARLTVQYTRELDEIEKTLSGPISTVIFSELKKVLKKYIDKKKTPELMPIAQRAMELKKLLENGK